MRNLSILFILSALILGSAQASVFSEFPARSERGGGVVVGNGGYSIQCGDYGPYRSYDLLVAQSNFGAAYQLHPEETRAASFQRIREQISRKLPALLASFDEFTSEIFSEDPAKTYSWLSQAPWFIAADSLPPHELFDSHIELCLGSRDASKVNLAQTIVRQTQHDSGPTFVHFYYDVMAFYDLPEFDRSFLLVHEWLWNFTDDLDVNREADFLLHSTWIEQASSKEVIKKFKDLGIQYP